jgi:hypothetical protein
MTAEERVPELEATLRDIINGCDMMMQVPLTPSFKAYVLEVKRVASAPLEPST